jgi:NodT family efflux transporter outer membrane factor (OMF) lipoprotein
MNALSLLIGDAPGAVDEQLRESKPVPPIPKVVDVGVPSALARRRPDIRQAEAKLHAATANVGVAVASFYPDISLTGNIGMRALDASYLTNWASHFYTAGPAVSLPIFSGGRLTAGLTLARAGEKEAALSYRATVLNALREVEDALVTYRVDRASRDLLQDTLDSAQVTWDLARNQYDHGLSSFINVLNAESTVLGDRQALVHANVQLVNDIVSLYRALGGGWEKTVQQLPNPYVSTSPPPLPGALDRVADPRP